MNDENFQKFLVSMEKRDAQFERFLQIFQEGLKDHDLLVRLDEKFSLFASAQMEHRERIAKEIGLQHASIIKAHERLDSHEKENNAKFDTVFRIVYLSMGGFIVIVAILKFFFKL